MGKKVGKHHASLNQETIPPLLLIPQATKYEGAEMIGRGAHSEVYKVRVNLEGQIRDVVLKIFSTQWKEEFEAEVNAYERLLHGNIYGVVAEALGCDRGWDNPKLLDVLKCGIPPWSNLRTPVSALMLEYIEDAVPVSSVNVDYEICKEAMRGINLIHSVRVLHHDVGEENILLTPSGRIVWIDFSNSLPDPSDSELIEEKWIAHSLLWMTLVRFFVGMV